VQSVPSSPTPFTTKANGYGPSDGAGAYKDTKSLINADQNQIEMNIISTPQTADKAEGHKTRHQRLVSFLSLMYCIS